MINITLASPGDVPNLLSTLQALFTGLTAPFATAPAAEVSAAKPAPSKPKAAAPAPTPVTAEAKPEVTAPAANDFADGGKHTLESVRALVAPISKGGKRDEVKALLTKFGADSVTNLDPTKFSDFVTELNEL